MYTDSMVLLLLAAKAEDYLARAKTHGGGFPPQSNVYYTKEHSLKIFY